MPKMLARSARLLTVAMVLAACMPAATPSLPPATAGPTAPVTSVAPTISPTTVPTTPAATETPTLLQAAWVQGTLPSVANVAVRTEDGWAAVGNNCGRGCDSYEATSFVSADGITWKSRPLNGGDQVNPADIVSTGDGLFAIGSRYIELEIGGADPEGSLIVWSSTDGTNWKRVSTIDLGPCNDKRCFAARTMSAAEDGGLVIGTTTRGSPAKSGVFRSDDGRSWTQVSRTASDPSGPPFVTIDAISAGASHVVAGACDGCPVSVWTSSDGNRWTPLAATSGPTPSHVEMATDGATLVLAQEACAGDRCTMTLWRGDLDGPLTQTALDVQLDRPRLASVGDIFVLAGMVDEHPRVFASTDGVAWVEQPTNLDFEACKISDLAPGADEVLLLTDADCGTVWLGRVQR